MDDVKRLMRKHWLLYASYVILERALPRLADGLKPVQRRILHTLMTMHDGKFHKVANVVGQTMAYHPHGDAPISEALVNLANKGFLLDTQGNFGNIYTGDPAAASRYIETRLAPLALEALFNEALTTTVPSYDGRHQEPVSLPSKIPLLLMQGAEGIAVGMSTRILPHNFNELLQGQIALLRGQQAKLLPDFPTGGIMDASAYDNGRGKVRLRARLDITDPKTIVIRDICYGTTTESLIHSIDEAAKKGKIKIDTINDYTAEKVEVEIKLPRGQYAQEVAEALYAFTECEVTLHSQIVVIDGALPVELSVDEILRRNTDQLLDILRRELLLEQEKLQQKIFLRSLEQIFIEERMYLLLEEKESDDAIHEALAAALRPFHALLTRPPEKDDRDHLLGLPIRRISRFDRDKNESDIKAHQRALKAVEKNLQELTSYAIAYLEQLLKRYGEDYPRRTAVEELREVDKKAMERREVTVHYDDKGGFIGAKVDGGHAISCTNFDKLLILYGDGSYQVINIPEKQYIHQDGKKAVYVGVADKKTVLNVLYRDPTTLYAYGKRFVVTQYILDKLYRYLEEGTELLYLSSAADKPIEVTFVPKLRQKSGELTFSFHDLAVKGVTAKGVRLAPRAVKKVKPL